MNPKYQYVEPTEFVKPQRSSIPYSNQKLNCQQEIIDTYEHMGSTLIPTLASCGILGVIGLATGCTCYKCKQKRDKKKYGDGSYNYPFNIDAMNGDFDFVSQDNLWIKNERIPHEIYVKKEE